MIKLGDTHNFGRNVYKEKGNIYKPRSIFGEYLIFSKNSKFAIKIRELINNIGGLSTILPFLNFKGPVKLEPTLDFNVMEECSLRPVNRALSDIELKSIGAVICLINCLGVADIHDENLLFGLDKDDNLVFSPIDLECIFYFGSKTYLSLFPSEEKSCECPGDHCPKYGLQYLRANISKYSKDPNNDLLNIIEGFFLLKDKMSENIVELKESMFSILKKDKIPVRRIMLATNDYLGELEKETLNHEKFFTEEKWQLENGDVPYFFSFLGDNKSYYWISETEYKEVTSFTHLMFVGNSWEMIDNLNNDELVLYLVKYFDFFPEKSFKIESNRVKALYKNKRILITLGEKSFVWKRNSLDLLDNH